MSKKITNIFKGDKVIWMVFLFLCLISIIEVFSASSELTYKGSYLSPIAKHVSLLFVGFCCMVVNLNIQCRYFKLFIFPLLGLSAITLIMAGFFGESVNGAGRWITILGITFQPSEMAKGALVLATASILSATQTDKGADARALKWVAIVSAVYIYLILRENLSTALLLCATLYMMLFIGRCPAKQLGLIAGGVIAGVALLLIIVLSFGKTPEAVKGDSPQTVQTTHSDENSFLRRIDTWKSRILNFNKDDVAPQKYDLDKNAQVAYANIAIASSNIIGKGPGNSEERDFLSQAFSDFIYAIIIEETGIEGAAFVALLYIILLFRTGRIANRCENNFPAFLAMGLALLMVNQALFNMCVAVGWVPVTGQPLPLISKGGTSSIFNCIYMGVILSVSRSAKKRPDAEAESSEAL